MLVSPSANEFDCEVQQGFPRSAGRLSLVDTALWSHPIVNLISFADAEGLEQVHAILCMLLAEELDKSSTWVLDEAFMKSKGSEIMANDFFHCIAPRSVLTVLAHVKDLDRVLQVRGWKPRWRWLAASPCLTALMSQDNKVSMKLRC
jgi:hypothetical protein